MRMKDSILGVLDEFLKMGVVEERSLKESCDGYLACSPGAPAPDLARSLDSGTLARGV